MKDSSFTGYMKELKAATEETRVGDPTDVQSVHDLVGAMGQSFTTTIFAFQQVSTVKSSVSFVTGLASKHKGEPWLRAVVEAALRSPLNTLRTRYQLHGTAELLEKAASLVASTDDDELIDLLRWISQYLTFLARRIRNFLPFYELSIAFEGHRFMTERAVPPATHKV